jgi:Mrp family chromosome partitioning ATPase
MSKQEHADIWDLLEAVPVNERALDANRVISARRENPAHSSFDVLRTRILQALQENRWRRVAVTSPTAGCGKTFTCANLAISLSRYESTRTVLMDMDLRKPNLHNVLGVKKPGAMADYLRGMLPTEDFFHVFGPNRLHIGANLAFGLNGRREEFTSELLQDPLTEEVLEMMEEDLDPDIVLFDLPPALANDDVIAFRPQYDAVLVIAGGGLTKAQEIRMVTKRLGADKPILGVVLNQADGLSVETYGY